MTVIRNGIEYYDPIETRSEKAIVRVYRPVLTEEERARRMKQIEKAAADLFIACMRGAR